MLAFLAALALQPAQATAVPPPSGWGGMPSAAATKVWPTRDGDVVLKDFRFHDGLAFQRQRGKNGRALLHHAAEKCCGFPIRCGKNPKEDCRKCHHQGLRNVRQCRPSQRKGGGRSHAMPSTPGRNR